MNTVQVRSTNTVALFHTRNYVEVRAPQPWASKPCIDDSRCQLVVVFVYVLEIRVQVPLKPVKRVVNSNVSGKHTQPKTIARAIARQTKPRSSDLITNGSFLTPLVKTSGTSKRVSHVLTFSRQLRLRITPATPATSSKKTIIILCHPLHRAMWYKVLCREPARHERFVEGV